MAAGNKKPEHEELTIPFSSSDEVWSFYKSASSKYRIDPFYYVPNGETVDRIIDNFKSEFLNVSTDEDVLEDMLSFFNNEVIHGDWDDITTESDETDDFGQDDVDDVSDESTSNDMNEGNDTIIHEDTDKTVEMDKDDLQTTEVMEKINQTFIAADENTICKIPFAALENSRIDVIDICLKSGVDLNMFRSPSGHTLLMKYVSFEIVNLETLDYLLTKKMDVNINEPLRTRTTLFASLTNRKIQPSQKLSVVKKLIHAGSTMITRGRFHSTALHMFIYELLNPVDEMLNDNWQDIFEELLMTGLDINSKDYSDSTPLMSAISRIAPEGEVPEGFEPKQLGYDVVEYLLKRGADPDIKDGDGRTSLYHSVLSQNVTLLNILVKYIKYPDAQDRLGMNCIYGICAYTEWTTENEEIDTILFPTLEILAKAGCSPNTQAIDRTTVLHHAAATHSHLVCEKLCNLGADVNKKDYLQRIPLHLANRNNDTEVINVLVKHGANVNSQAKNGETPLHHACLLANINAAKALIVAGAEIETQTVLGVRPIHLTAENGDVDFIQYIAHLSNINATDIYGANAMHFAAADGNIDTLEYLLTVGCDKDKRDENGNTPLDLAVYMGHQKVSLRLCAPNVPRFGNLPPLCFPNRPLIDEEEVEHFYNELADKFKSANKMPINVANDFLVCKGLGKVNLETGEAKLISDLIVRYAENIAARVGELDPLFSCSFLRAGSTYEGVKTGYPDEFDFLCSLTVLGKHVEKIEYGGTEGFMFVRLKESAPSELFRFCPRSDRRISASHILRYFSMLSRIATYETLSEMDFGGHLYAGYMLLPESGPLFSGNTYPLSKLNGQTVSFRGRLHKLLDISIDFNPVIFTNSYPQEAAQSCSIIHDVTTRGIYCLPKLCGQVPGLYEDGRATNEDLWRLSTQHIEAETMRSMTQLARDCYVVCKVLRMEPLTCSVKYLDYDEVCEDDLMKLMPSGAICDADIDSAECSLDEGETNDLDEHCQSTTETSFRFQSEGKSADESGEDASRHGTVEVTCGADGYRYAEGELTAEKLIPSYYIKSIFIKEMNKMIQDGQVLSERSLLEIPRRVYEELLKAIEEKELTTLFMPKHNMLRKAVNQTTKELDTRLRETYCRKIIWLMDQLKF